MSDSPAVPVPGRWQRLRRPLLILVAVGVFIALGVYGYLRLYCGRLVLQESGHSDLTAEVLDENDHVVRTVNLRGPMSVTLVPGAYGLRLVYNRPGAGDSLSCIVPFRLEHGGRQELNVAWGAVVLEADTAGVQVDAVPEFDGPRLSGVALRAKKCLLLPPGVWQLRVSRPGGTAVFYRLAVGKNMRRSYRLVPTRRGRTERCGAGWGNAGRPATSTGTASPTCCTSAAGPCIPASTDSATSVPSPAATGACCGTRSTGPAMSRCPWASTWTGTAAPTCCSPSSASW